VPDASKSKRLYGQNHAEEQSDKKSVAFPISTEQPGFAFYE